MIKGLDFGIEVHEVRALGDPFNDVVGHRYADQIKTEQDLEKIQLREVVHDEAATAARVSQLEEIFDGVLEVRSQGALPVLAAWDRLDWHCATVWVGICVIRIAESVLLTC